VTTFNQYNKEHQVSLRRLCEAAHVGYSSFLRWQHRRDEGRPAVLEPGPRPVGLLDMAAVEQQVENLHHVNGRTHGTGALYEELRGVISRRKLRALVKQARDDEKAERRAAQWQLEWNTSSGKVWATDTKEITLADGSKVWFQTMRDLGSRYTLAPCAQHNPTGKDIAGWLDAAFTEHGAPLFLRMDNAANENCPEVMAVLERHWVIPFNSPPYYPPYNGAVERAQREIEEGFLDWTAGLGALPAEHIPAYANATINDINHKRRPILDGRHACQVFTRNVRRATLRPGKRKEVVQHLTVMAAFLVDEDAAENRQHVRKAWRRAVECWLESNNVFRVVQTPECQPIPA
jgi:transposase InsO family protein